VEKMSSTIQKEIARLKKATQIATLQAKIKEVRSKPLPSAKIKKAAKKTKAKTTTPKKPKTAAKTTTAAKKSVTPKVSHAAVAAAKKPQLTKHHIGPAAKGETIIFEKLVVEDGHLYIIHLEGEGTVTVKDYDFKGGALQIVEKK
jgi:hypothetical protein